jgi:putative PIN family toxin of toxin-antitoxin system
MGTQRAVSLRVVFDTTTVLSALLFANVRLAWLRQHWREGGCVPLISRATAAELTRVFRYPGFGLSVDDARELLGEYLPHCKVIGAVKRCELVCRHKNVQPFLDLAKSGRADVLVSSDRDLLALAGQTGFGIETAENYGRRVGARAG